MNRKYTAKVILVMGILFASTFGGAMTSAYSAKKKDGYDGKYEFIRTTSETQQTYESSEAGVNAVLARDGTINFSKASFIKSGDVKSDDADYTGVNAAVLSIGSSKIKIMDSSIVSRATHASAVFAFGDSTIDISDSTIETEKDSSPALSVTNGGVIMATNVVAETTGDKSIPIKVGKDGGTISIIGGKYKSTGNDSPAVYTTANVKISDSAKFDVAAANAFVIENTKEKAEALFTLKDSNVTLARGNMFSVSNANTRINVEKTIFKSGADVKNFLNAKQSSVIMSLKKNPVSGDIKLDENSKLDLSLATRAQYKGAINSDNKAKNVVLKVDRSSVIILTGDSYVSELRNSKKDNSNIYANGHKLFVNGKEVSIKEGEYKELEYDFSTETTEPIKIEIKEDKTGLFILLAVMIVAFLMALTSVFIILSKNKARKQRQAEREVIERASRNNLKKPWERA